MSIARNAPDPTVRLAGVPPPAPSRPRPPSARKGPVKPWRGSLLPAFLESGVDQLSVDAAVRQEESDVVITESFSGLRRNDEAGALRLKPVSLASQVVRPEAQVMQ